MTSKLRVAAVGAGYFSRFQYEAWDRMDDVEIVAVCDRERDRAEEVAKQYGVVRVFTDLAEMLDAVEPDLVDIVTPPTAHLDCVRLAAKRRIAMICQKPFCQDLGEAEQAVDAAAATDTLLVVHENFRFQPWYAEARRLLDAGALGQPYQVSFRLRPGDGQGPNAYLDRQPYFQTMQRFLVHETAIHLIDTFRYLMGEVRTVYARLDRLNPAVAGEDAGVILFDFESGGRGLFDGNRLVDHPAENRRLTMGEMLLEGSEAVLRLDGDGNLFLRLHGQNGEQQVNYAWENKGFGGDCVFLLQRHVVDYLRGQGGIVNTGRDYLMNLAIEQAVYQSAEHGCRLTP